MNPIVEVKDLSIGFRSFAGKKIVIDHLSFAIQKKQVFGLVGESGSGKSVTGLSIMGLIPQPGGYRESGDIFVEGESIFAMSSKERASIRGKKIAMIFQEPMTSLNPVMRIGPQICEVLKIHEHLKKKESKDRVLELLQEVGIPDEKKVFNYFPHQLSGGMRQRVMIAMALSCRPSLLIADEPTTALDVTIQAQILELMQRLVRESGISILFITHDLGVISEMADEVAVMYCGQIIESGVSQEILRNPMHPYTKGLIEARPGNYSPESGYRAIKGSVPEDFSTLNGCRFAQRCQHAMEKCFHSLPPVSQMDTRYLRCFLYKE